MLKVGYPASVDGGGGMLWFWEERVHMLLFSYRFCYI